MKKKILLFLLLFIPFMINAEEKCTIVSGNGQDIGSEIACGTEHFYIIEDKEDSVRMLAKYNLDIGSVMNKITVTAERYNEIKELCSGSSYCDLMFEESEFVGYKYIDTRYDNEDGTHTYMIFYHLDSEEMKQNSQAIGAHGDEKGNPEFPEYGIISDLPYSLEETDGELYGESYIDFIVDGKEFRSLYYDKKNYKLEEYLNYLNNNGISAKSIDILSVKEIDNIVYKITNTHLPLEEWATNEWEKKDGYLIDDYYLVGSIKEYLPEQGYEWLYGTTYWTKTAKKSGSWYYYFVDSLGNLCNMDGCNIAIGAGIRPVVEISKESINYNLTTKSDNGGTLETDKSHVVGDTIVLNAKPKTGYKLEKLIVTTDSGTTIEVSGKDIVENEDGTISINPEVFTMPLENVVVEAKWAFVNPKTGVSSFIGVMFTLLLIGISAFFMIKNYNNSYEL